ncbi:MAG: acetyl-CoA carboxylase biotin carboxyl carrier protein [Candidatus Omnitrophota bacterium]|jgi:acetyl-CoA carboxylase biotin carboxyl carrier protein
MNIKKIKELVELMNDNDLMQVEIEEEGTKVKLTKNGAGAIEQVVTPVAAKAPVTAAAPAAVEVAEQPATVTKGGKDVKSPMVGTFYKSASPDSDPYVKVGDVVQKGDVLCIVEAMKLMNEVKAEFGGKVLEICVDNADPVEYGQNLFIIEPA